MRNGLKSSQRRHVLLGSASALAAVNLATWAPSVFAQAVAALKPLPPYLSWKDGGSLIVHSATTVETKRSIAGAALITPAVHLYIRNNLPTPDAAIVADRDAWAVSIEGVKKPRTITVAELKKLGVESLPMVMQCSGNGRGFFPSKPSGTPWTVGAAGCVIWRGVPVRSVVAAMGGVTKGLSFMTGTGGEVLPAGVDPKAVIVERSVPASAMADAMLAWEMNGAPIPLAHGGPLRLIVPGYAGVNHVKYVKRLAFTATESDARIMSHGYRVTPLGGKSDPSQPSVQEMNVKSWIYSPSPDAANLKPDMQRIEGVAFGGVRSVKRVEVSVDGGATWAEARLVGLDLGKYAWRQFVLEARLPPGSHVLVSRATDTDGRVQPRERLENAHGYNNNSWADHGVTVTVA